MHIINKKRVMKETVFKVGDRVYCLLFGWGKVKCSLDPTSNDYPVEVIFKDTDGDDTFKSYTHDGCYYTGYHTKPTLSFTEYKLDGFSQERPIELPETGEIIMVSNDLLYWSMVQFSQYNHNNPYPVAASGGLYRYFKRLR